MERVNKTITFGSGDKELYKKLKDKGYFDRSFNFTRYIKDLIMNDLEKPNKVFTDKEEDRILELIDQYIQLKNSTITSEEDADSVEENLTEFDLDFIESLGNIKEMK